MILLMLNFLVICLLLIMMFFIIIFFSNKSNLDFQKSSPFECGFNPVSFKRLPFSIHFFLIAVIFLIFDIEVIIIFPSILTFKYTLMLSWLLTLILFLLILMLGLVHEWINGMLKWTN